MYYRPPLTAAKERLRKALREMLFGCLPLGAIFFYFVGSNMTFGLALIAGLICAPILWGLYRFGRFVLNV